MTGLPLFPVPSPSLSTATCQVKTLDPRADQFKFLEGWPKMTSGHIGVPAAAKVAAGAAARLGQQRQLLSGHCLLLIIKMGGDATGVLLMSTGTVWTGWPAACQWAGWADLRAPVPFNPRGDPQVLLGLGPVRAPVPWAE
jgi:hypothetical protein